MIGKELKKENNRLIKIIWNIFALKTLLILFGIMISLIISFLLLMITGERSDTYYGVVEKHATDDVNFIVAYHNYNGTDCIDDTYKSYSSYFDEFVHEVKENPSILFYKKIEPMSYINYINEDNIISVIKLLTNSKCIEAVDLNFTSCHNESIKIFCETESLHLKSITLRGFFDTEKIILMNKSGDLKCLYKMQKAIEKESLLLTKRLIKTYNSQPS